MAEISQLVSGPVPASRDTLTERLLTILEYQSHLVLVAEDVRSSRIVGWLHAYEAPTLLSDKTAEGGGLIIHNDYRRNGVGKLLVETAEKWAKRRGLTSALLATRIDREESLKFYSSLGFNFVHTTHFLSKKLV
jgi:GNAT superfamily N-acetyltransferase